MNENPWQSPTSAPGEKRVADFGSNSPVLKCPECSGVMEPGYLTTGAWLYWRRWDDRSLLVRFSDRLMKTLPSFVGTNRLPGFRCSQCEVVVFRYGNHRHRWTGSTESE